MILFDLDGTLVDSLPDIADALAAAMRDRGHVAPSHAVVRTWIGGGARNLVAHAVAAEEVEPVLARFRAHYAATPVAATRLYDGIAELLDGVVARGHRLAILSNKPHDLTVRIAAALLARWPFVDVVGGRDGTPLKPSPVAALAIAAAAGVAPQACTMVGDAPSDVVMARAAGMRAVAVTWGYRPRAELVAAAPDVIVDEPRAFPT
ncbi:MAG: HAD-IA family hydrolase [Proteobacteria bacterium]|nr:HAD-IA family hydrolase [Pseudomonadota bacterium]